MYMSACIHIFIHLEMCTYIYKSIFHGSLARKSPLVLPSDAAVWARLNPGSLTGVSSTHHHPAPHCAALQQNGACETPLKALSLFPGPSGTDIVIKPKGASSWKVVRPPLENAEDALARERTLVQRTLQVVAQLYTQQQQCDADAALVPASAPAGGNSQLSAC